MKKYLLKTSIAFMLLSALLSGGCVNDIGCIEGNGYPIGESRSVADFHEVHCNGSFDVRVLPSDNYEVIVDAESNIIQYIRTSVSGGKLYIETQDRSCINNTIPMIVTVYAPSVDGLEVNGSGSIDASDLYVSDLYVNVSGSGDITVNADALNVEADISGSGSINLSGITDVSNLHISGSGNIYAYQMPQLECTASISGSGNIYVSVDDLLDATISGSGYIYYRGFPVVYQSISGSGRVVKQ
jgi:hypothetical protein